MIEKEDERVVDSGSRVLGRRYEVLSEATKNFSLVCGGPFYQLLVRTGLVKPPLESVAWRAVIITAIAWVPLFLITALSGCLMSGVRIPFLYDIDAQVRLLLALPLLIVAEISMYRQIRILVPQFVEQQIVTTPLVPKFEGCVESAVRLRNSAIGESVLLVLVIMAGNIFLRGVMAAHAETWYSGLVGVKPTLTPAGYWYLLVSFPIVEFICLRWYFRLFIWARLLWQLSKLDLNLVPSHPDHRCGLGFLAQFVNGAAPFIVAHSLLLSGFLANRILYEGGKLHQYDIEIAAMAVFLFLLAVGPLFFFTPALFAQSKTALYSYGSLAGEYVNDFQKKWILGQRSDSEPLIGTPDLQSLADLATSFRIVQKIVPVPFDKGTLFYLVGLIVLPLVPLLLTVFSVYELIDRFLKVLF